jgi:prolyl oligopeptidase
LLAPALVVAQSSPPPSRIEVVTDTYFGTQVADPYRWLENDTRAEVAAWNKAQNDHARAYLDSRAMRPRIHERLTKLVKEASPSWQDLTATGSRLFVLYNDPQFQQPMLVALDLDADPKSKKVVLDPNKLDPSGHTAIDWYVPSHDGQLVAVSLSKNGSEDGTLHVFNVDGQQVDAEIPRVQYPTAGGSLAWAGDNKHFWYTRYPDNPRSKDDEHFYLQAYLHEIGRPWQTDSLALSTADGVPRIGEIFLDTRYAHDVAVASVQLGDGGQWAHWLLGVDGTRTKIAGFDDGIVAMAVAEDKTLYLVSRNHAPRYKILKLSPGKHELDKASVFVPEDKAAIIISGDPGPRAPTIANGRIYVSYINGGPGEIRAFDLQGQSQGTLPLPQIAAFSNVEELPNGDLLMMVGSYLRPNYFVRWNAGTARAEDTELAATSPVKFDDAEVVSAFATSKDGTQVPVHIVRKRGLKLDGKNPTLLYGYGGYGVNMEPHFAGAQVRLWLDAGGVYAEANIRGGAEYGESWHEQGSLTQKQNVFDDFAAAARYLLDAKYTNHNRLALRGASNGGLLMGAMITQHPEFARAVVSSVGIYDMLRVERDPNGAFNTTEFGTVKNPEQFKALYAYSPYHHVVKNTAYPAVLMMTGANDGRVNPLQSRKFAAALQAATSSKHPILLRISGSSGHGMGTALTERIDQGADTLAFLFDQLGMEWK